MKLREKLDKFVDNKPTKFEEIFVYTFAAVVAVACVVVVALIVVRALNGNLF